MKRPRLTGLLLCAITVITAGALVAAVALFIDRYRTATVQTARTSSAQAVSQVADTVGNYVQQMDDAMALLADAMDEPARQRDDFLEAFLKIRPEIAAVTTYNAEGELLHCWSAGHTPREQIVTNLSFDTERMESMGERIVTAPHVATIFEGWYPWVVTMIDRIDAPDGACFVALDLSFSSISKTIANVGIGQHGYCFLLDQQGNLVYHPQQQLIYAGLKSEDTARLAAAENDTFEENGVIYSIQAVEGSPWRVVGVSYVDEQVNRNVAQLAKMSIVIVLAVLAAAFLAAALLARIVTRPLQNLAGEMERFEQDADQFTYQEVKGTREVGELSASFGHMVVRIQQLMATVRQEEINLRKTELKALQAQINPHFLYNTLDSIAWMCERGKNADAVQMVHALARLFRISISKGHELIPIAREIEHAESYLQIQKYRYKNQFTYHFQVDPACTEYLCNKITLQPIIENAITHGLDLLVDEGHIEVEVLRDGEDILFKVTDNGVGMEPEQVQAIFRREPGDRTGIGIKNVNDRLRIYFGEGYGLTIDSVPDEGTTVTVRMPRVKEGSYETK